MAVLGSPGGTHFQISRGEAPAKFAGGGGIEVDLVTLVMESLRAHEGGVRYFRGQTLMRLVNDDLLRRPGAVGELATVSVTWPISGEVTKAVV